MGRRINDETLVEFRGNADVKAAFIGCFRFLPFGFAGFKVIIDWPRGNPPEVLLRFPLRRKSGSESP